MTKSYEEITQEKPIASRNVVLTECERAVKDLGLDNTEHVFTREASMLAHEIIDSTEVERLEVVVRQFSPVWAESDWEITPIESMNPYFSYVVGYRANHARLPQGINMYFVSSKRAYNFLATQMNEHTECIEGVNFLTLEGLWRSEKNIRSSSSNERAQQNMKAIRPKLIGKKVLSFFKINQ